MAATDRSVETALDFTEDPRAMLRRFLVLGLLCLAVLLTLATYGIFRVYSWRLAESAQAEAQAVCQVVMVKEKQHLLSIDELGRARLQLAKDERALFNRRLQRYLRPFAVDAVLIRDLQQRIVNGEQEHRQGDAVRASPALARALAGQGVTRRETVVDSAGAGTTEQMVSYLPLWGRGDEVLGAIEIRRRLDSFRAEIRRGVAFAALLLGTVLLALFGCVWQLVKRGADRLDRAQQVLRTLATTDPLTGVFNRREVLARAAERFARSPSPGTFGILMVDVDDFKTINDRYGHPVGDRVLQEMVGRIAATLRPSDLVGRFGGEEFLVVLADSTPQQCQEIAERLCRAVREQPFMLDGLQVSSSISIGGATVRSMDRDLAALLQRADQGLYRAKNHGKGRAYWVGEPQTAGCSSG